MPRANKWRSIFANQSSTWLSQEEYVGVKCQVHPRMRLEEPLDAFRLVSREIVDDDMNLPATRLSGDDVLQELDERITGVARDGLADDLRRPGIECGLERERAMVVILKPLPFGTPGESGSTGSRRSSAWIAVFSSAATRRHAPAGSGRGPRRRRPSAQSPGSSDNM
jgi:hypothetical protein